MNRKIKIIGVIIFLLMVGVRVYCFFGENNHYNSDTGVLCLMAKHIAKGIEKPIFWYGHSYLGAMPAYILAVFFLVFGIGLTAFKIYALVLSVLLSCLIVLMVRSLLDEKTAVLSAVFLIFPPVSLITGSAFGGYQVFLIFGVFFIWLVGLWLKTENKWYLFSLGIVGGLGWYTHPMFIYFIATFLLIHFLKYLFSEGKFEVVAYSKELLIWLVLFLLGALPYFVGLKENYHFFNPMKPCMNNLFLGIFWSLFHKIPHVLGLHSGNIWINMSVGVVYLFCIVFSFVQIYKSLFVRRRVDSDLMFHMLFFVIICICALETNYSDLGTARHLLPLIVPLPILIALTLNSIFKKKRFFRYAILMLMLCLSLYSKISDKSVSRDYSQLFKFLQTNNLNFGVSDFWLSYKLVFLSDEKIIISPFFGVDRYDKYTHKVIQSDNKFYLFDSTIPNQKTQLEAFDENLLLSGLSYEKKEIDGFVIFHSLTLNKWNRSNPVKYFRPTYEEYLDEKYIAAEDNSQIIAFELYLPSGSYNLFAETESRYFDEYHNDKRLGRISIVDSEGKRVFCKISIKNGDFEKHLTKQTNVNCYLPVDRRYQIIISHIEKDIVTKYLMLL